VQSIPVEVPVPVPVPVQVPVRVLVRVPVPVIEIYDDATEREGLKSNLQKVNENPSVLFLLTKF